MKYETKVAIRDAVVVMILTLTLIMTITSLVGIAYFWDDKASSLYLMIAMLLWLEILGMSILYVIN